MWPSKQSLTDRSRPVLVAPSLLAIKLFEFLWFVETYVKGYILKLLLVKAHIKRVRDIVETVVPNYVRQSLCNFPVSETYKVL
jgi:hypothetical protein